MKIKTLVLLALFIPLISSAQEGIWEDSLPLGEVGDDPTKCATAGCTMTGDIIVEATLNFGSIRTMGLNDQTPDISGGSYWKTNSNLEYTDFDGEVEGDFLIIVSQHNTTKFDCTGALDCGAQSTLSTDVNDTTVWIQTTFGIWNMLIYIDADQDQAWGATATFGNLSANSDIGFGSTQVPQGDLVAPLASPTLTGNPLAPTASADDNDTSIATTAYVQTEIGAESHLGSSLSSATNVITSSAAKMKFSSTSGQANTFSVNMGSTANTVVWGDTSFMDFGAIFLKGSGALQFAVGAQATGGAPINLTVPFQNNSWTSLTKTTGQQVVNLQPAVRGMNFCIIKTGTGGFLSRINPDDADTIQLPGASPLSAGVSIDTSGGTPAQGDYACFVSMVAATWLVTDISGPWASGP